jgi:uncharacterized membrane protein
MTELADAVRALPQNVLGVMFNIHGEALIYTTDNSLLHSDLDWQPVAVVDGVAQGIVLDMHERAWVTAMWLRCEEPLVGPDATFR